MSREDEIRDLLTQVGPEAQEEALETTRKFVQDVPEDIREAAAHFFSRPDLDPIEVFTRRHKQRQVIALLADIVDPGSLGPQVAEALEQAEELSPGRLPTRVHGPIAVTPDWMTLDAVDVSAAYRDQILAIAEHLDPGGLLPATITTDLDAAPLPGRDRLVGDDPVGPIRAALDAQDEALVQLGREIDRRG